MTLTRRSLHLLALAALSGAVAPALAQTSKPWPDKPIRFVTPYPPGGSSDVITRFIGDGVSKILGQPVIVENKPGAATLIGAEAVAKAAPDGYTLLLTSDSTITSNPFIYARLPYDPVKDLAPVTQLIGLPQMVVAHPSLSANTLGELVTLARTHPNISYGSYGSGSQPNLLFEALKQQTGIQLLHVPYKGIAPAVTAALAGEVQLTMAAASVSQGHIKAGKLKPLAIARSERLPLMPDVPTLREAGYPDIDPKSWFGLFATAGTPPEIIAEIQKEVAAMFADPAFREKHMLQRGFDPVLSTPAEFARFIQEDMKQKARLVKVSGAKAE